MTKYENKSAGTEKNLPLHKIQPSLCAAPLNFSSGNDMIVSDSNMAEKKGIYIYESRNGL